ncbi:MAG: NAD-binding oxidoreductase, partial [Bacteroidales bacterium]
MYDILKKRFLAPDICLMEVLAPRIASSAKPGQFLIVRVSEAGERIPLTVCDYDREAGSVTIVTQQVGASSRRICALEEGDAFTDFAGPLGVPSAFIHEEDVVLKQKKYLFIAGGLGTAPVYPQVKYLHEKGAHVEVIIGAKTKNLVIMEEEMRRVAQEVYVCTD